MAQFWVGFVTSVSTAIGCDESLRNGVLVCSQLWGNMGSSWGGQAVTVSEEGEEQRNRSTREAYEKANDGGFLSKIISLTFQHLTGFDNH